MPEPDPRAIRLAELRAELNEVLAEIKGHAPGTPERDQLVLKRYEPLLGAVMALGEELSED